MIYRKNGSFVYNLMSLNICIYLRTITTIKAVNISYLQVSLCPPASHSFCKNTQHQISALLTFFKKVYVYFREKEHACAGGVGGVERWVEEQRERIPSTLPAERGA